MKNYFFPKIIVFLIMIACSSSKDGKSNNEKKEDLTKVKVEEEVFLDDTLSKKFGATGKKKKAAKKSNSQNIKVTPPKKQISKNSNKELVKKEINNEEAKELKTKFQEWDSESKKIWDQFNHQTVRVGERQLLHVSYLGFSAASVEIVVHPKAVINKSNVYHFSARAKSSDYYSWIYELDDLVNTYVSANKFLPVKYSLVQDESSKKVYDIQLHDRDALMTHFRYKRLKDGKEKRKSLDKPIPFYHQDLFSSFFFIRGLPLKKNDVYKIPTTTKGKTWILKVKVLDHEEVTIGDKDWKAKKVSVITEYDGELAKRGDTTIWLSDDKYRAFLKFESEVKIGSIKGEIKEYFVDNEWMIKEGP
jgi:hypothetical protein